MKSEVLTRPFFTGNKKAESKKEADDVQEEKGYREFVRPFILHDPETVHKAKQLADYLYPVLQEDTKGLERILAEAVYNSKVQGYGIQLKPVYAPVLPVQGMLNFDLYLINTVIEVSDQEEGERCDYRYSIGIRVRHQNEKMSEYTAEVPGEKVKDTEWLKKATRGLATLPRDKEEREEFTAKVQRCIETQGVPVKIVYANAGWRNIPGVGYRYVYSGGAIGLQDTQIQAGTGNSKYTLNLQANAVGSFDTFRKMMHMCDICRNGRASMLILIFTHAATISTLFELAGFPIKFLFGLVGITNSRKTSMVLAMAKLFNRDKMKADAEFTATACGIEELLSTYKDAVLIIDDYRPGENKAEQKDLNERLRTLVRLYGDRVPKKRMNAYAKEKHFFPVQGACILTMELVTGVASSLSRMFLTEIDVNEVDNQVLAYYQENPWIVPTHFYDFLLWVTKRFDKIVELIQSQMQTLRTRYKFKRNRFGEMYATMTITAGIIAQYALERRFWDQNQQNEFFSAAETTIIENLRIMERQWQSCDKGLLALKALNYAIQNQARIPEMLTPESCMKKAAVYQDETRIFVQVRELRRLIEEYCRAYYEQVEIVNDDEIIGALEGYGALDVYENKGERQRSRKLPIQRGNSLRYLYIKKEALEKAALQD